MREKIFKHTAEFLDTHVSINNPHRQSGGMIVFFCKYYIRISDTLIGSILNEFFLFLTVI